jgi:hypothetical protein
MNKNEIVFMMVLQLIAGVYCILAPYFIAKVCFFLCVVIGFGQLSAVEVSK